MVFCLFTTIANGQAAESDPEHEPVIWKVSFEGNESYSGIVLKNVISASSPNWIQKLFRRFEKYSFNETELRRDRVRIMRYYQRRGYDQANVELEVSEPGKEWKKHVLFRIREGEPIRVESSNIVIEGDSAITEQVKSIDDFQRARNRHELRKGQIYQTTRIADVEGRFTDIMKNNGYPWSEAEAQAKIDSVAKKANVNIVLRPGPQSKFTNFHFEGVETVPDRILRRELEIRDGQLFDRRKIQNAQRQLFGHHLIRFATIIIPDQEHDSTLDLQAKVRENPLRTVQAAVGFGSEEYVRGQLSWRHRNINGKGHRLGFSARSSFIEQRAAADYLIPYVFNSRSSFVANPFLQRMVEPAFELMQLGISNSLIYQIERTKTVTGSYEFTINEENLRRQEISLPDSVQEFNISSLVFTGYYNQSISREPRGWVIQPSTEFSGTFGEASFKFQKLTLDVRHYKPVSNSTTLAGRVNMGTIFYAQPDSLPINIRFFSGGTNSVRGWSRQSLGPKRSSFKEGTFDGFVPVGGRAMFTFNLEVRQDLNFLFNGFGMGVFLDGGQVWRAPNRVNERPIQFGAGGGLRYQSPIGPVRIDLGYKVNPTDEDLDRFRGEDFGSPLNRFRIHFSIGQAF